MPNAAPDSVGDQTAAPAPSAATPARVVSGKELRRRSTRRFCPKRAAQSCQPLGISFRASQHVRSLRGQPCDLAAALTAAFPLDELLAARVLVRGGEDQVHLTPVMGGPDEKFLVLNDAQQKACDFASAGCHVTCRPAIFAICTCSPSQR